MAELVANNEYVEATPTDLFSKTVLFKQDVATAAKKRRLAKNNIKGWLFSMWPFVGYCIFSIIPFVLSVYLSMTQLNVFDITQAEWIGLDNYKWIFTDEKYEFWWAILQTLYYCISLPIGIVLGLGTSVMLTRKVKCTKLFRTILFIPNVCSSVGVTMMWTLVFAPLDEGGIANTLLNVFGYNESVQFFKRADTFMPTVIFTTTWSAGAGSLLFQAALEQVNRSLIEAAQIDGASKLRIFFRITLPAISPTTFYVLTMNTIGALQVMGNVQLFAGGGDGPFDEKSRSASLTAVYFVYYYSLGPGQSYPGRGLGLGSACAWVLTFIILIITRLNFKLGDYWVCYDN